MTEDAESERDLLAASDAGAEPELTPRKVLYALVGLGLHLVAGFFMLVSGLVAPQWAVAAMLFIWAVLAGVGLRLWRTKPWVTIGFPVIAFLIWIVTIAVGGALLDWNASPLPRSVTKRRSCADRIRLRRTR